MTTNFEVDQMANKLNIPNYRGCIMMDELGHANPNEIECAVVNLQRSSENGSHWVAYYKKYNDKYFFCSYGSPIPVGIKNYLGSPIKCHNFQIQSFNSVECGELCILFLYLMSKGLGFDDVVLSLLDK